MLNDNAKALINKLQYIIDRFVKVRTYSAPKRIVAEPHNIEKQSDNKYIVFFGEIVSDKTIHAVNVYKEPTTEQPVPDFPEYVLVDRQPLRANECYVDRENNLLYFHSSQINCKVSVTYYSIGVGMLSSALIYTHFDSNNKVIETLYQLTRRCQEELDRISTVNDAEQLKVELRSYIDSLLELMRLYPNPKEIIAELETIVANADDLKFELGVVVEEAQRFLDELKTGSNKTVTITPAMWTSAGSGRYSYEYWHNLNTTNLIITTTQIINGIETSTVVDYEKTGNNKIKLYTSDNSMTIKVVMSASYFPGLLSGVDIGVISADNLTDGREKVAMTVEERNNLLKTQDNISNLQGRMTTSETDIVHLNEDIDGLNGELVAHKNEYGTFKSQTSQNFATVNSQLEQKSNRPKQTIYLNEYIENKGITITDSLNIAPYLQECINNGDIGYIEMPQGYTYYIGSKINIDRNCNINCKGVLKIASGVTAFELGLNVQIDRNIYYIERVIGTGRDSNSVLFSLRNAKFNQFHIPYAREIGKCIEIKHLNKDCSIGENQFYPHLWFDMNIAFDIIGADTWENRCFAEGNQLLGGFISRCNYGIKISPNILYSGMLVTTAIDNFDLGGSWDYYNEGTESPTYNIANLLLFRFIRFNRCKFSNIDSYWDANLKLRTSAEIEASGLKSIGSTGTLTTIDGNMEVYNPYIKWDFKNDSSVDYHIRQQLVNNEMKWSSPNSNSHGATQEGFKIYRGRSNVPVTGGATNLTINHIWAVSNKNYTVVAIPKWDTTVALQSKSTIGFNLTFGTACPAEGSYLDYFVVFLDNN